MCEETHSIENTFYRERILCIVPWAVLRAVGAVCPLSDFVRGRLPLAPSSSEHSASCWPRTWRRNAYLPSCASSPISPAKKTSAYLCLYLRSCAAHAINQILRAVEGGNAIRHAQSLSQSLTRHRADSSYMAPHVGIPPGGAAVVSYWALWRGSNMSAQQAAGNAHTRTRMRANDARDDAQAPPPSAPSKPEVERREFGQSDKQSLRACRACEREPKHTAQRVLEHTHRRRRV